MLHEDGTGQAGTAPAVTDAGIGSVMEKIAANSGTAAATMRAKSSFSP